MRAEAEKRKTKMSECCNAQIEKVEAPQVQNQYDLAQILANLDKDQQGKKDMLEVLKQDLEIIEKLINKIRELV